MSETPEKAASGGWDQPNDPPTPRGDLLPLPVERRLGTLVRILLPVLVVAFILLRLWNFTYDVPPYAPLLGMPGKVTTYAWDAAVYADEGLYAHDAIVFAQEGKFYLARDYNQFINLPLLQIIKGYLFAVFGISLFAARMMSFVGAVGMVASVYYLVRRYEDHTTSLLAAFVVAVNHFIFAFSRYAIDEVPVAFLVTLAFAFAVRVRGERWWIHAILTAATFACALLVKTNAIFATPLIGAMVILQELDARKILSKFLLCSAVFLAIMGAWYVALVIPHKKDFVYFFSLNVGITGSSDIGHMWRAFEDHADLLHLVDATVPLAVLVMTPLLIVLHPRYRLHPLVYLSILWYLLYMAMYAYYGRFYPRFFSMTVPPVAIWVAVTMRAALDLRGLLRLAAYGFAGLLVCSALWQVHRDASILAYGKNTWNEMAAEFERIIDADASGNRVIMGHTAGSLALRANVVPRHDRYGVAPLKDRFETFKPGWIISEGDLRQLSLDGFTAHTEWYDLYYDIELVARHDILDNFRGHAIFLYKLTPRENVVIPPSPVRAKLPEEEEQAP